MLVNLIKLKYFQSFANIVSCIIEGNFSPSNKINYYDNDVIKLLNELLNRDPTNRPNASAILSHPHILPYVLNYNSYWFKSGRKIKN